MRTTLAFFSVVVPVLATVAACSSSSDAPAEAPPAGETALEAPPAGQGVQFRMTTTLAPSYETERCQMFQVGPEGLAFDHSEVRYTPGSHHVLLYETAYTSFPTKDENGVAVDAAAVHDCAEGATKRWHVSRVVGGSQNAKGDNVLGQLPAGVAIKLAPGTIVLMNTHYLNTAPTELAADARINLWSVPASLVKEEAGVIFFYDPFIRVAARSKGRARMRCPVSKDLKVSTLQSHMHKRGVDYAASLVPASGAPTSLYTNTQWSEVPVGYFAPELELHAGDQLDYHCDYQNDEDHDILQGPSTKDEMCMLIGAYHPRDTAFENCRDDKGAFLGQWIGNGTATCKETLTCLLGAFSKSGADQTNALYACVTNTCEAGSPAMSEALKCEMSKGHGACEAECSGGVSGACTGCVSKACAAVIDTCNQTACTP